MLVTVRHTTLGVFEMKVRGFKGVGNSDTVHDTMDTSWTAARKVSEKHADFLTEQSEGWAK